VPKLPRWKAAEAEAALLQAGFVLLRSKGSHRIYQRGTERFVIPFHGSKTLHPKIVKQVLDAIE
jgi:predicted RNA binding protein YcfA (HicA-like mRNA interferase family)